MKKLVIPILALFILALGCGLAFAGAGNDLPSGERYMLNVIAHDADQCPTNDFTGSNRHTIVVQADFGDIDIDAGTTGNQGGNEASTLLKTNTIALRPADDFRVVDGNACDGDGAEFELPTNVGDYNCGGITNDPTCTDTNLTFEEYEVYVRLVGKPYANKDKDPTAIGVTTCGIDTMDTIIDTSDDMIICSTESVVQVRKKGGKDAMNFTNVSRQLLTMCINNDLDPQCDIRVPLFDDELYDYFWQWNTQGKAHAQLVFIPVAP